MWPKTLFSASTSYNVDVGRADPDHLERKDRASYLDLLCRYDPEAVVRNLDSRGASYFDLDRLIEVFRTHEVAIDGSRVSMNSDAVLWALDRLGRSKEAFEELDTTCARTADSLVYIASSGGQSPAVADELLGDVRRCVNVAVRLCIERANAFGGGHDSDDEDATRAIKATKAGERLDTDEVWYRLLRSLVRLVHDVAHLDAGPFVEGNDEEQRPKQLLNGVRDIVQDTLSDLISSTAAEAVSFPALFRRLTGSSNNDTSAKKDSDNANGSAVGAEFYAEIRSVLDGMLSAYHLRAELLAITNKLFDRDTYHQFRRLHTQRKHGWRPAGGASSRCAGCDILLIGPKRGTVSGKAGTTEAALVGDTARETVVDVEDLRRKAFQQSRASSFSRSPISRRASASQSAMLTPPTSLLQHQHRRAKSPYDEKAAPLASPRIDKGKGVIRSASSEFFRPSLSGNGSGDAGHSRRGASESATSELSEVDGYFAGEFETQRSAWPTLANGGSSSAIMTRSNSTASSIGFSLRINDEPQPQRQAGGSDSQDKDDGEERADEADDEEDGDGTLTPSHFGQQRTNSWANENEGETSLDAAEGEEAEVGLGLGVEESGKEAEKIVVQKSGLMYHESCWKRAHPERASEV